MLFAGRKPNEQGNCDSELDFIIRRPDGSIYAEHKNVEPWRNKPPIPRGRIGLAVRRIGIVADPEDPLGVYLVSCKVKDLVAGIEFEISTQFEVLEELAANKAGNRTPVAIAALRGSRGGGADYCCR